MIFLFYFINLYMIILNSSLTGLRKTNEDSHYILNNLTNKRCEYPAINIYAICDGHGLGGDSGKKISSELVLLIRKYFSDKNNVFPLSVKNTEKIFDDMQQALEQKYKTIIKNAGSTALIVVHFQFKSAYYLQIFNVGDCRAIISYNNKPVQLTTDHKPANNYEKRRIEKLNGSIVFDGMDYRIKGLSVSRAMGDISGKPYISHQPDIYEYRITGTDKFIVLGCDGLWDVLSNEDVHNFVNNNYNDTDLARKLAQHAIKNGSMDNVSVIIVKLKN